MKDTLWRSSWLNDLKLRFKAGLGLGVLVALFAISATAFLVNQREMIDARRWNAHTDQVLAQAHELQVLVLRQQMTVRSFLLTRESNYLNLYEADAARVDGKLDELVVLTADNPAQQTRLMQLRQDIAHWRESFGFASSLSTGPQPPLPAEATPELIKTTNVLMERILLNTKQMLADELKLLQIRSARLDKTMQRVMLLTIAMLVAATLVVVVLLRGIRQTLSAPLTAISDLIDRLTAGDLRLQVPTATRRDEIGAIMRALEKFRQTAREVQHREWLKSHSSSVSMLLSRQTEFRGFASALLEYLAPVVGAGHAALFRRADGGDLLPVGGYGIASGESLVASGLVAQCAQSGQTIELKPVPADYVRISSGVGSAAATAVYLLPLKGTGGIAGVIEFAAFKPLDSDAQELLAAIAPNVGLALEALSHAIRTAELLEETQIQQEELQASEESLRVQQEELRTTNDAISLKNQELEEQSARLRSSEEELRVQAEELRNTYEAMAEKSRTLDESNQRLRQMQLELERKNEDVEQASRYKSEFLANMSHELRTPLNSVLILAKDLADNGEGNLSAEQIESAQIIHDSGQNLLRLINDILDLSKIEAGRMDVHWEPVQLADVLAGAERNFRAVARERGIELKLQIDSDVPQQIRSDASKIGQVLTNLIGNALKFTHAGRVSLRLSRADSDAGGASQPMLALSVSDTGIGIAADKLERLFRAFEQGDGTTSRRYGGTGLGLSISLALARILGGDIRVISTPGEGSTFTLLLPVQGSAVEAAADSTALPTPAPTMARPAPAVAVTADSTTHAAPPAPADDREQIQPGDTAMLIIEDDAAFARILSDMARQRGYRVLRAADGESGLALAEEYRPRGILLDVGLPGMDGWSVIERLKARASTRNIPVHFISASDETERGLAMGAVGFLTKPASRDALEAVFGQVLGAGNGRQRRVLVIDDDPIARRAIVQLLAETQAEVVEAATQSAALLRLGEQAVDCIVLDLVLPDGSGLELLDKLSRLGPLPPVVVHSARDLSHEELLRLREYTDSIVIKGTQSPTRLLDEVSLFLHAVRKPKTAATQTAEKPADLAGRSVLVVDDDMRNVFALSRALRGQGLNVIVAQDGERAIEQLAAHPQTDWVLMDIMMPVMDGYTAMRKIRERPEWAQLPILAITAKAMKGDREACLQAGANDYLTKPIDMTKLLSMMRAWTRPRPA
ncbi:MAG TPA: response regulator [Fontimonas sp.]